MTCAGMETLSVLTNGYSRQGPVLIVEAQDGSCTVSRLRCASRPLAERWLIETAATACWRRPVERVFRWAGEALMEQRRRSQPTPSPASNFALG